MPGFKFVSWIATGRRRRAHDKPKQNHPERSPAQLGIINDGAKRNTPPEELRPGWFYWKLGRLTGPFNDAELLDLLDKGELGEDSLVTLMNMPLATLLRDPAKRFDFQTKVHLKRPSQGLQHLAVTSPDGENHERAIIPAVKFCDAQSENVTAWRLSNPVGATKYTEDLTAARAARSTEDDDKASYQVNNDNSPKKIVTFTMDLGDADASASAGGSANIKSEASEVDDNAHTDRASLTAFKVGSRGRCKDQGENVTARLLSNPVGATKFTDDLTAASAARSTKDDDKASYQVNNDNSPKKIVTFTMDLGDADASTSAGSSANIKSEASEVDDNAHTDRTSLTAFKVGSRVRCKDQGENWHRGIIISVAPLLVKPDDFQKGFQWDDVEFESGREASDIGSATPRFGLESDAWVVPSNAASIPSNTAIWPASGQPCKQIGGVLNMHDIGSRQNKAQAGSSKASNVSSKTASRRVGQASIDVESQVSKLKANGARPRKAHRSP